jgi:exopolyphosphatase/guanosine-5'-triphosphate,3'-diphosphate pyrophosphatase
MTDHQVVGFIDLGTNSARLLVVRLNANHSYTILTREKQVIRLGEGEFTDNLLSTEAIERTVLIISRFTGIARNFGATDIVAVATSATRDARNREDLLSRVRTDAGIELNVISGPEEARLIWLGVSGGFNLGNHRALFIDIGGGSTEIIIGNQVRASLLRSIKVGAIRTTNAFIPPDRSGPLPDAVIGSVRLHVRDQFTHIIRHIRRQKIHWVIGSSGTILSLESVAACLKIPGISHRPGIITLPELSAVVRLLCRLSLKERRNVEGLNPERADIIVAGAIILECLLEMSGLQEVIVSPRSLRDGLLSDYLSRIPGFPHAERLPVRDTAIRQLGRSCHIDESHAGKVTELALSLFDSGRKCRIHSLSDDDREILSHAAYLHDIGQFISYTSHHQHSFYLITHAPLVGFHEHEILKIALLTRYHRKKMPGQKDPGYRLLLADGRRAIRTLSLFLRMAENLDRSHDGRVISASFSLSKSDKVVLDIRCQDDSSLEQWAIRGDSALFKREFHKKLAIRICPEETAAPTVPSP